MSMKNLTLPELRRPKLAQMLAEGRFVRVLEAHNGLSALIANDTSVVVNGVKKSYDALWESSLTDTASKGLPDAEIVGFESRCENIRQILDVTDKPMIVDGDTGRDAASFEYMVKALETLGVSAVIIEDKKYPKRNSLEEGSNQHLENIKEFCSKIERGRSVKQTQEFMIIARLESLIAGTGLEDAINRAEEYLKAGADGIMIHSKAKSPDEILKFCSLYDNLCTRIGFRKPLVCVPTTYNSITDQELAENKVEIVIHANHLMRAAYKAMSEVAEKILLHDRSLEVDGCCATTKSIFQHVGFLDIKNKDILYAPRAISAIIPAAGSDPEFELPKALLKINDRTLLERQHELLLRAGITDINCVVGFKREMVKVNGVHYHVNDEFAETGILHSLFKAREKMENGFIYLNSDILFNSDVLNTLINVDGDIVLCVDNSYAYHKHQIDKELDLVISRSRPETGPRHRSFYLNRGEVVRIGKKVNKENADYEFTGIAKFSEKGADILIKVYNDLLQHSSDKPFHEALSIKTAGITDLLQEVISRGIKVEFVNVYKGWIEIHDMQDLELAREIVK